MPTHHEDNGNATRQQPESAENNSPQRTSLFRSRYRPYLLAAIVSLFIHVGLFITLPLVLIDDPHITRAQALQVWLTKKPPSAPTPVPKDKQRAVIQIIPTPIQERPKDADYLAEHNSVAKKEQQIKKFSSPKPRVDSSAEREATKPREIEAPEEVAELGTKLAKPARKHDPLGLRPHFTEKQMAKSTANASDDFVHDVKVGNETELNAWQWRHAPFFNRIRSRVGQIWAPQAQIARFDPQGTLLGQKDRVTVLQVTIDRQGYLRELTVTDQSGVAYLDDEAERTFKEAAPFLYPPQELFATSDEFSFSFAFHLYLNRGFSFGFDWQKD